MASVAAPGPESVVTVKINYDGCTRRAKMVLRDMVPMQLESQVRSFLRIPSDRRLTIERYSDSAGSYVLLDNSNVAVYKQLYRAAKAKSKLKLRVTDPNADEKPMPRPVTVEEVPDVASSSSTGKGSETTITAKEEEPATVEKSPSVPEQPVSQPSRPINVTLPLRTGSITKTYDGNALSKAARHLAEFESMRKDLTQHLNMISTQMPEVSQQSPATSEVIARRMRSMQNLSSNSQATQHQSPSRAPVAPQVSVSQGLCTRNTQGFAVCCNSCDKTMPDVHYHCSTCDDGDFDLCSSCVDLGITCHSPSHWMIKRNTINGQIVNSTTEVIPPKAKKQATPKIEEKSQAVEPSTTTKCSLPPLTSYCYEPRLGSSQVPSFDAAFAAMRTCNNCVASLPEKEFLHCTSCADFDLCKACFGKNDHGHHPIHGFVPAVHGAEMPESIKVKMAPGRNQMHHAICDGCDKFIMGVRHKCLDCPDWDYCAACHTNARFVHPGHRFVPIYTPLVDMVRELNRSVHQGVCCDGPICANGKGYPSYIRGVRYKCAVCDDVDFCATCEAHPSTQHNKTHPLIKIKTPIRHMSVTTSGETAEGTPMRPMGDASVRRVPVTSRPPRTYSATHDMAPSSPPAQQAKAASPKPVEEIKPVQTPSLMNIPPRVLSEVKTTPIASEKQNAVQVEHAAPSAAKTSPLQEKDLSASFVRDTVVDGTIMPPNHIFEQSWVLRNDGPVAWPAGCSVKYVGGDYMGHVDSNHPAEISKLVSASESVVCYEALAPGQEFAFNVLLRTPSRPGKFVSYWRLSTADGLKFGHRLWCDVSVRPVKVEEPKPVKEEIIVKAVSPIETPAKPPVSGTKEVEEPEIASAASSRMIFPKLEKESPAASMHEQYRAPSTVAPSTVADDKVSSTGVPDESAEDEDWDVSEDGFLTDEEYDILDASDEEFLEEQAKKSQK